MKLTELHVDLGARSYPILIGTGLLGECERWASCIHGPVAAVVTNETIAALYLNQALASLQAIGKRCIPIILPDGEQFKTLAVLNQIFDALLSARCDRKTTLVALGGGVIGDMTGFAAATYQRGVDFVQVPTTLLAQVDSSVGGKTGINHPLGKNMIGAFHQPRAVLMDLNTLESLPPRELSAGLAEVIKHGAIADPVFFSWLEDNMEALRRCDVTLLQHAVLRSCEIKAEVVRQDEREGGLRAILNFGHTFGHAIEAGLGYGVWLHGEAVGAGMVQAAELSRELGLIDSGVVARLRSLVEAAGLPVAPPVFTTETWLELMAIDKKADGGKIRFVLLERLGAVTVRNAPYEALKAVLDPAWRLSALAKT